MEVNSEAHHEQQECVICLDDVETEWRDLECHHRYHKQCIENWITVRATCPMCMKKIENKIDESNITEEIHNVAIRRFMIFMCFVVCVIIVMVLCSS